MPTTAIQLLKTHPAQMRTIYDLDALATLTLQIYERGLDEWQPIVASPHSKPDSEDGFHIVSGHRRHRAQLLAFALRDWAVEHPKTEISVEVVRAMLNTLVQSLGSLDKVLRSLLVKYGTEEIPFVLFEGSQKVQILALQAANYGSDQPDMLGVAHSFSQAVGAGATVEEIARNCGQTGQYVRNHLALTEIPPELAQRIASGDLPVSVAMVVADLPEPKRSGLAIFILANGATGSGQVSKMTAKAIKTCATTMKKWSGLQMPLMVKHQSQRNIARALVRLWSQVVDAYPEDAYAAAAMFIYRGVHEEPWSAQEKLTLWFQSLGGDTYFTDGHINWTAVVEHLISEVSCQTCPIAQLPKQQLHSDLAQGQGGPLGMPCRVGQQRNACIHGLAANDNFDVRVPWEWGQHLGIINKDGDYRAQSYADLLTAWQTQQTIEEQKRTGAEEKEENDEIPPPPSASTPAPVSPPKAAKDSPIVKQRAQIANFMKRHEKYNHNHPFATSCGHCRHRLDSSPTKDESVPHCAWAGRLRNVTFKVLTPNIKDAPHIPVCRQFAPTQLWHDVIPAHPEPPTIPRDWLKEQIVHLVKAANRHGSNRNAFEFLTGRPMGANENYGDWFKQQLDTQGGELSDAQLFTLFVWAHTEWQRARSNEFSLPLNRQMVQFGRVEERPFPLEESA